MELLKRCAQLLPKVRETSPLVHHLTNFVTATDCANITLAVGGSPIMAMDSMEVREIASISSSLVLNIGTLSERVVESMLAAGKAANEKDIPVVFDPVGAGASSLRSAVTKRILEEVKVSVIRCNISEARAAGGLASHTKGVDASNDDQGADAWRIAAELAQKAKCVVAVTGARDVISDGVRTVYVDNGNSALSTVTGTGCMCTSLVGAFAGANPKHLLQGTVAGILCMGIAGEIAFEKAGHLGSGSYRTAIMDAISLMDEKTLLDRGIIGDVAE